MKVSLHYFGNIVLVFPAAIHITWVAYFHPDAHTKDAINGTSLISYVWNTASRYSVSFLVDALLLSEGWFMDR